MQDWGRKRRDLISRVATSHYLKYPVTTKNCEACKKEGKHGAYTVKKKKRKKKKKIYINEYKLSLRKPDVGFTKQRLSTINFEYFQGTKGNHP